MPVALPCAVILRGRDLSIGSARRLTELLSELSLRRLVCCGRLTGLDRSYAAEEQPAGQNLARDVPDRLGLAAEALESRLAIANAGLEG